MILYQTVDYIYYTVFLIFQISFIIQLYYTVVIHQPLSKYKDRQSDNSIVFPVSVIICARNEEANLKKNLALILEQDYQDFEVLVVNDCSNDETELVLRDFSRNYERLKVVTVNEHERFKTGKKFAVTLGIKAAKYEYLLFTDADCRPASNRWLQTMQQNFNGTTEIVLGYSPYERLTGFVNKLIRFETFFTALNYLSFAISGTPYMGVGRNMAYTKSLFFRGKGFASHMHIPSGDDDLFVNQNATYKNTKIEINADTHIWTEPKKTLSAYITQKLRHLGAGKVYKREHKRMLSFQSGSAILFYALLIVLIFLKAQWWFLTGIYIIRLFTQCVIYYPIFKKLKYEDLIWWFPLFDFIFHIYMLILYILTMFKKKIVWK